MSPELKQEKLDRLKLGYKRLTELTTAEPSGDPLAQMRAAATFLTESVGIARPLSDRYLAEVQAVRSAIVAGTARESDLDMLFSDGAIARVSSLDDKYGLTFMVLPEHVEWILKGGKQMSRRFRKWGDEGDIFRVKGKEFRFTRVSRLRVGDITDDDILKEGYTNREDFEQRWVKSHPKSVKAGKTLNQDDMCWCHEYEAV